MRGLRAIHDESSEVSGTRVVFTPTPEADLGNVTRDLRSSRERARLAVDADRSRRRAEVANQDLVITPVVDDWFVIRGVLVDSSARRPADSALADAAHLVDVSLYGDEDR